VVSSSWQQWHQQQQESRQAGTEAGGGRGIYWKGQQLLWGKPTDAAMSLDRCCGHAVTLSPASACMPSAALCLMARVCLVIGCCNSGARHLCDRCTCLLLCVAGASRR
jgi:hypothetical protein